MARKYSGVPIRPDDIYDTEHVKPKRAPTPPPQLVQDIQPIPMPLDIHPKDSFDPKLEERPPILDPGWGCMTDWGTPGPITSAICKRPNPEDIFKNPKGNECYHDGCNTTCKMPDGHVISTQLFCGPRARGEPVPLPRHRGDPSDTRTPLEVTTLEGFMGITQFGPVKRQFRSDDIFRL